jgi:hypothetical protein
MSKLVKRWEQKDDVGSHAIGFIYVSDMSDLLVPVVMESWTGQLVGSLDSPMLCKAVA